MKPDLKERILAFNRARAEDKSKAEDLMILLGALPPGQVKHLLRDKTCAKILDKYGITGGK